MSQNSGDNIAKIATDEEYIQEVLRIYDEFGRIDKYIWEKHSKYDVSYFYLANKLGGMRNVINNTGRKYIYYNELTKEEIIARVLKAYSVEHRITKEICQKYGVCGNCVRRYFGNHGNMYKELGLPNSNPKNITKGELIRDIQAFIEKYNSFSSRIYRKYGKYSESIVNKYGGWENILKELGIISRKNSQPECMIQSILESHNIDYNIHKGFSWLVSDIGTKMFVDFYLPDSKTVIEYDGEQHYKYVPYWHRTYERFVECKKRDLKKEKLILEHGMRLFRIIYSDDILLKMEKILSVI